MDERGTEKGDPGWHGFIEKDVIQDEFEGPGLEKIHHHAGKEGKIGE
jgi:hypothetical protein